MKRLEDQVTVERTKTRILVMQISHDPGPWWLSGVISWDGDTSTRIWVKTSGLARDCHPFWFNKLDLGEIFRFTQRRDIIRSDKIPGCGST